MRGGGRCRRGNGNGNGTGRLLLLLLLLLPAGCTGAPIPGAGPWIRVEAPSSEVPFGAPFPLLVTRRFDLDTVARPFDEASLAPLLLRPAGSSLREAGGRREEVLRFTARAFRRGAVPVPAVRFEVVPLEGGTARAALSAPFTLRVRPALDPASPGPLEVPAGPFPIPRSPLWPAAGALCLLGAGALLLAARARRRAPPPPPSAATPAPDPAAEAREAARARLRALREREPADGAGIRARFLEVAETAREFLERGRGIRTRERTTEEAAAAAGPLGPRVLAVLGPADLVKFAEDRPGAADLDRLLAAAAALLAEEGGP